MNLVHILLSNDSHTHPVSHLHVVNHRRTDGAGEAVGDFLRSMIIGRFLPSCLDGNIPDHLDLVVLQLHHDTAYREELPTQDLQRGPVALAMQLVLDLHQDVDTFLDLRKK